MKDKMTAIKLSMHTPQYMLDMRNLLGVNTPYYVSSIKNYVQKERDEQLVEDIVSGIQDLYVENNTALNDLLAQGYSIPDDNNLDLE